MNNYVTGEIEHSSLRSAGIHFEEMHFVCLQCWHRRDWRRWCWAAVCHCDSLEGLVKGIGCCNSSERHNKTKAARPCLRMQWGTEDWIVYFGTGSTEVYVYIGTEHKINSEYKKSLFTSIPSQEYGSLYTWQKYQRPVWSYRRLFTLWNKSTRFRAPFFFLLNSCLLEFWWWNVAACSVPSYSGFLSSSLWCSFCYQFSLSQVWLISVVRDLTTCGYAAISEEAGRAWWKQIKMNGPWK